MVLQIEILWSESINRSIKTGKKSTKLILPEIDKVDHSSSKILEPQDERSTASCVEEEEWTTSVYVNNVCLLLLPKSGFK